MSENSWGQENSLAQGLGVAYDPQKLAVLSLLLSSNAAKRQEFLRLSGNIQSSQAKLIAFLDNLFDNIGNDDDAGENHNDDKTNNEEDYSKIKTFADARPIVESKILSDRSKVEELKRVIALQHDDESRWRYKLAKLSEERLKTFESEKNFDSMSAVEAFIQLRRDLDNVKVQIYQDIHEMESKGLLLLEKLRVPLFCDLGNKRSINDDALKREQSRLLQYLQQKINSKK